MRVEFSIYAKDLKNNAGPLGTSDPFAVVTRQSLDGTGAPTKIGRTETLTNDLSPHWVKVFTLDHEEGGETKLIVTVFHEAKSENKSMGSVVFEISELLGARGNTKSKKLKQGGQVFAVARELKGSGVLRLGLKGSKLKNVEGMFSKSDPFFELSRKVANAGGLTWDNVYRSEKIKNNLDPVWETAVMELSILCGGDPDVPIKVSVFDHESSGKHIPMGSVELTVNEMDEASDSGQEFKLKIKGKETGSLFVTKADIEGL